MNQLQVSIQFDTELKALHSLQAVLVKAGDPSAHKSIAEALCSVAELVKRKAGTQVVMLDNAEQEMAQMKAMREKARADALVKPAAEAAVEEVPAVGGEQQ